MIYLEQFRFITFEKEDRFLAEYYQDHPWDKGSPYPFGVLSKRGLHSLDFAEITILYGGNGSGKSTALNMIGCKLKAERRSAFNKGDRQSDYLARCTYKEGVWYDDISMQAKTTIITSDDIFKYMLDTRGKNEFISVQSKSARAEIGRIKRAASDPRYYTANERDALRHLDLETGENVDTFSRIVDMKKKSCAQFVKENIGEKTQTYSNGETGFMSLVENIVPDRLYILDEPENSLSCKLQQELARFIESSAKHCGCQFIIATHSPFLLALPTAKIYNLDGEPAAVSKFWELPNMRSYYELFHQFDSKFRK